MKNQKHSFLAYRIGQPIKCHSISEEMEGTIEFNTNLPNDFFSKIRIDHENQKTYLTHIMEDRDMVIGLGQSVHRMNKRGTVIRSFCSDDARHTPEKESLYGAHNFFISMGSSNVGVFIDFPGEITYDIGFGHKDQFDIIINGTDFDIYFIDKESAKEITQVFLQLIGQSYVPPKWGFGYQQCRWSYKTAEEIKEIGRKFRTHQIPCDTIYLDIDYMERYKDFTVCEDKFPNFPNFVKEMREDGFRIIPIIDAGVKIEKGYDVYEEGVEKGYFCKDDKGNPFVAAVWPGLVHFPDFLNSDARKWFGNKYKVLTDMGIEGFWNDMNEPAIFYTPESLKEFYAKVDDSKDIELDVNSYFNLMSKAEGLANSMADYQRIYHNMDHEKIRHDKVHNLYGYNMTKSAAEGLMEIDPDKRFLLFSRASTIGMHRYSGIWTGDNSSWWEHILMAIRMMPAINMCGFLYSGCDTGGFSHSASSEMIIRWTQFSIFTPLLRNHSVMGSRYQEPYSYDEQTTEIMRNVIELRYALIPYLYSEYMKAALSNNVLFSNLILEYDGERERYIDDQILCGESLMITPIYENNARGRFVYLPEDMVLWNAKNYLNVDLELMKKGDHYINVELDQVPIFIRKNRLMPIGRSAETVEKLDNSKLRFVGYIEDKTTYSYYDDDGISQDYKNGDYMTLNISVEKIDRDLYVSIENINNNQIKELEFELIDGSGTKYYLNTECITSRSLKCKRR